MKTKERVSIDDVIRQRRQWQKPWAKLWYQGQRVELVSYPWSENGHIYINVRMEPGDPTSMVTIRSSYLNKHWIKFSWGIGTTGMRIGGLYFDFFIRPYFGMFSLWNGRRTWRKLPYFKVVKRA